MTTINITINAKTVKKVLVGLGIAGIATVTSLGGAFALTSVSDKMNPNIVPLELEGKYIGNWDCVDEDYRAPIGNELGLNPLTRYDMDALGEKLISDNGLAESLLVGVVLAGATVNACPSPVVEAPVAQAPVVIPPAPVVAPPAPITPTYDFTWQHVGFNGDFGPREMDKVSDTVFVIDWDNHTVTYTLDGPVSEHSGIVTMTSSTGKSSAGFWYTGDRGQVIVESETGNLIVFPSNLDGNI